MWQIYKRYFKSHFLVCGNRKSGKYVKTPTMGITNLAATIATVRPSSTSTSPAHIGLPPLELGAKTEASWLPNAHARFTSARSPVYSPERSHAAAPTRHAAAGAPCAALRRASRCTDLLWGRWPRARPAEPPAGRAPAIIAAPPQCWPWGKRGAQLN